MSMKHEYEACHQDAERRQAETRAKQQQRQREVEATQQEAQERRQQLADQKLSKLAGMGTNAVCGDQQLVLLAGSGIDSSSKGCM